MDPKMKEESRYYRKILAEVANRERILLPGEAEKLLQLIKEMDYRLTRDAVLRATEK